MRRNSRWLFLLVLSTLGASVYFNLLTKVEAYVIDNFWADGDNIVMDDVFLPAATWSNPAQFQLSEWNEVDTTDNSHPFRISLSPEFSFGANDGDNTMGFLGEAGLNSEYGLSYAEALAWTVCWSSGPINECDMMLNPALPWQLVPDPDNFFQSTVLHEAGHIRGLDHYNSYLSMQNSGVDKILRGETLYMDDKEGVRQNASHVQEFDMVIYNKFHTGSVPAWMTVGPTTARVGETINFNNFTVENRGTLAFGGLRFGTYLSPNDIISTGDQLLNTGSWGSFGRFTFGTFNWSASVPSVSDCGTQYIGAIIDDNNAYSERYEGNNAVAFSNGGPNPQPFSILLERDALEPNDSFAGSRAVALPFSSGNLTLDQDLEQDFFRFTLARPSLFNVAVNFSHALGDVDLDLRNSSNVILESSTSTGNSEAITRNLTPGTYTIRTYGFNAGSCNRYSMTANAIPLFNLTVAKAGTGSGTVAGPGINCGFDCQETYISGTIVTLTATPAAGSVFAGWSGDPDCTDGRVTINNDKACTAAFNLRPPTASITVVTPNGGETWPIDSTRAIQWNSSGVSGNVQIQISRNGGTSWTTIINSTANDGAHNWKVAGAVTTQARIRVRSVNNTSIADTSNANFRISGITVLVPNGGETWAVGSTKTIRWTSIGVSGNVQIQLSRNAGSSWTTLVNNTANDGSRSWRVTGPATTQAQIRVRSMNNAGILDKSNANFRIQ